jgi:hypothetical protein
MILACFVVVCRVSVDGGNVSIEDLAGLHRRSPLLAATLFTGIFALAGDPAGRLRGAGRRPGRDPGFAADAAPLPGPHRWHHRLRSISGDDHWRDRAITGVCIHRDAFPVIAGGGRRTDLRIIADIMAPIRLS